MISQHIIVDVGTNEADAIHYVQGETGREISFTYINSQIPDEHGDPSVIDASGYTCQIHILKADGNFIVDNLTPAGTGSKYTLTDQCCIVGGRGIYDLSLTQTGVIIYTAHGNYIGDNRAIAGGTVNSISEAYGVPFPEGFQQKLIAGDKITITDENVISAEGETYTAGANISISATNEISATDTTYTAGANISISATNEISATDTTYTAGANISISATNEISANVTTYTAGDDIDITSGVISYAGDKISVIDLPTGDNTSSRTIAFITPPKFIKMYNTAAGNWTSEASFYWGQPIAAYYGANGSAPSASAYIGSLTISYSGNSMTMTGINALACFNNNTGFQKMVIFGGEYE